MHTTFRFELPGGLRDLQVVVELRTAVDPRQHVLLLSIDHPSGPTLDESGLSWSGSLNTYFQYVPASRHPGLVSTDRFSVPTSARALNVRVHSWRKEDVPAVEKVSLRADVDNCTVSILPEVA